MSFLTNHIIEIVSLLVAMCALVVTYVAVASQHKPHILIYYQLNPHQISIIDLIIENIGSGLVYDIKFSQSLKCNIFGIEKPIHDGQEKTVFENGIPYLSAGQKLIVTGGQFGGIEHWIGRKKEIDIIAKYKNPFAITRKYKAKCFLYVNHLKYMPTRKSADQAIVDSLKSSHNSIFYKIFKELQKSNTFFSKIHKDIYNNHQDS